MKAFRIAVISSIPPKTGDALWLRPDEQGTFGLYYPRPGGWHPLYLETNITEEDFDRIQAALEEAVMNNYPTKEEVENTYVPNTGGLFTGSVVFNEDVIVKDDVSIVGELAVQGRIILTGTSRIKGITTPVDNDEATNKEYVDNAVNGIEDTMREYVSEQTYTKAEVDQKIQTETATFRGTYDTWDDVPTNVYDFPGDAVDNNDYIVVRDSTGYGPLYVGTWRFKYSGSGAYSKTNWLPEYQINEEPLTPSQEAAINSGITSTKVAKLDALPTNSELQNTYMPKSGGTFTGNVNIDEGNLYVKGQITVEGGEILMTDDPASDMAAINKGYVDDGLSGKQDTLVSGTNIKTINGLSIIGSGELTKHLIPSSTPPSKRWIVVPQGVSVCIASTHDTLLLDSDANMNVVHVLGGETYEAKVVEYQNEVYLALGEFGDDDVYVFPIRSITELKFNKIDVVSDSDFDVLATVAVKSYQDKLVSGTNIKTINNINLLGSGNINIQSEDEIFYAQHNVTPYLDVLTAFNAGKRIIMWYYRNVDPETGSTKTYIPLVDYKNYEGEYGFEFCQTNFNTTIFTSLDREGWDSISEYDNGEVFVATYGSTTFQQVADAYNAGKFVVVFRDNGIVYKLDFFTASAIKFTGWNATTQHRIELLSNNTWTSTSNFVEITVNKKSSWSATPNNTNYPSEKLVKDTIDALPVIPSGGTTGQVLAKASGTDYDVEWRNGGGGGDTTDCVKYTQQSKTDNEKTTARTNIGITLHDDVIDVTPDPPIAVSYGKIGVISQTQTWTQAVDGGYDYAMNGQVTGLIPQADIDLFVANGATFNPNGYQAGVGYFELNGLTDISYNEMLEIYRWSAGLQNRVSYELAFMARTLRTNFNLLPPYQGVTAFGSLSVTNVDLRGVAAYSQMEVFAFMGDDDPASTVTKYHKIGNLSFSFRGISAQYYSKIKTIIGALNIDAITTDTSISFQFCPCLEDVRIYHLKANLGLQSSPRLTAASVAYMINNVGTTNNIVITLHATAYARANADADVQAALAAHTNVSLASA